MSHHLLTANMPIRSRPSRVHHSRREVFSEDLNNFGSAKREAIVDTTATTIVATGCTTTKQFALSSSHPLSYPNLRHCLLIPSSESTASCCRLPAHPGGSNTSHPLHERIRAQVGRVHASPPNSPGGVSRHKRSQYGTQEFCGLFEHPRKPC